MATIKPFKPFRPQPDKAAQLASVPYDVVNTEEARELAKGNPLSFLHVIRPEIDLPENVDLYDDRVYEKAEENFRSLKEQGVLIQESEPALYVYKLTMGDNEQIGIAACCAVDEYDNDIIKKHEVTRKAKEDDRLKHMLTLSAHTGPVLLTFRENKEVNDIIAAVIKEQPLYDFTAEDGITHTLWKVPEPAALVDAFKQIPALYIADGHHRAAGAARVKQEMIKTHPDVTGEEEFNYFLAVLFPQNQLNIFAYNRYISDLGGYTVEQFLEQVSKAFEVTKTEKTNPERKGEICMYLDGTWYELEIREQSDTHEDAVSALDLSKFQEKLLEPVLGITDQRKDERIDFVGGPGSEEKLQKRVDENGGVAFTFYPVQVSELLSVADENRIMPPKSTWFAPKLRSGLLVHQF
jgi:uncharacterized protein (DUF1015 family)